MKKKQEDMPLLDRVLRETFKAERRDKMPHVDPKVRSPLTNARRFVLDAEASAFLYDLSHLNLSRYKTDKRLALALDTTRTLARLPHKICWFEIDALAFDKRYEEVTGKKIVYDSQMLTRSGWLMEQHPQTETIFRATFFGYFADDDNTSQQPLNVGWTTDDSDPFYFGDDYRAPVDDRLIDRFETFLGFRTKRIAMLKNGMTKYWSAVHPSPEQIREFVATIGQETRRMLTLLACINDIPIGIREVKVTHGFVAKGNYHKFLDHSVIVLNLPKGRDPVKLARAIIAHVRRRAHMVRGHWRRNWRQEGQRVWVHEHQRGDASLGFVTHDYSVKHEEVQ